MTITEIAARVEQNHRIESDDALYLLDHADLLTLAHMAGRVRMRMHPEPVVTFVSDRNINYTNACTSGCRFCAFYRPPEHPEAYVLGYDTLRQKIEETLSLGGTQILLQGGMNPNLSYDDYLEMLRFIKANFPIHIHGFSPPEIVFIAEQNGLSVEAVLRGFIDAGLGSIPGGGAEILSDEIRSRIAPKKCNTEKWLHVMRTAHQLGLRTTATMMFGHVESPRHVIEHLDKVRTLQDETGGFTAFIPWTFQPANTKIDVQPAGAAAYLKVLAVSRIFLDNVDNIQASWVTQGEKIAQVALAFGANDFGSTMIEENVVAAAGVRFRLPQSEIVRLIEDAGYAARQRDCFYQPVESAA